jgi:ribosomal-protein-alanine N-acetyltransferase
MIYSQFSNDEVNRYLFDAEPLTNIRDADEIIEYYTRPEPRTQHRWILVRKTDGAKAGTCGFHGWDQAKGCCDIGYDLFPDFWDMGYMSEAMQAILMFARNEMEISQVNACIYPDNDMSIKLAEKFGFVFTGEMKEEIFRGQAYPHRIYVLDCTRNSSKE